MTKLKSARFKAPWLTASATLTGLAMALPLFIIIGLTFSGNLDVWAHLYDTVLADYVTNSLLLVLGVSVGVLLLGVPTAWVVSMCDFPGRKLFSWALLLPLAFPAYIIAYTYTGLLDFSGPVQSLIRDLTGLGYGEYWFYEVRSLTGAIIMLSLVLYPYVFLMARAAFLEQSTQSLEAGRTLGLNQWQCLFRLALPMARPAIITGLTLALMETLADYGTVQYFGVTTFTTGIFRTYNGFGDTAAAAQLASVLLTFVCVLVLVERYSRRKIRYHTSQDSAKQAQPIKLYGWRAWSTWLICAIPVVFGFLIPAIQLAKWAIFDAQGVGSEFVGLAWNSFYLAFIAAFVAVLLALVLAYAKRLQPTHVVNSAVGLSGMGYALPGTMVALGVIVAFAWLDFRINDLTLWLWDMEVGLILSGTLVALIFAYTVRFLAVSLGSVQSGLGKVKPSLDQAARSLGRSPRQVLWQIHVPLMRTSVLTALLIVFVDVLKELPATLMLRPFNFDTLAVRAFELAADERLIDAAPASLMIVIVGLLPVILLSRSISNSQHMVSNEEV